MDRNTSPLKAAIRASKPALVTAGLLSIFINLTMLASPLYSMQIYDRVLQSRSAGTLLMLTIIVGGFLALYGILEYARSGTLVRSGVRFHETIAQPLMETAMQAEVAGRSSVAVSAQKDAETLRDGVSSGAIAALFDIPWTPFFVALCYVLHPMLGLVALVGAILIFACAVLTEYATRRGLDEATRLSSESGQMAAATLRGAETVRGLGMGRVMRDRLGSVQGAMVAAQAGASERAAAVTALSKFVRMAVQVALLGVGAWLAIDRHISPGAMMAASIIMGRALAPIEQVVANWRRINSVRAAYRRLTELFAQHPAKPAATALPAPEGHLSIERLTVVPPGGSSPAVKGVSFSVAPGECLAVMGSSGSGKSSLAKAMANVWPVAQGAVRLDGAALSQWDGDTLGRHVGYVSQDVELFAGTIAQNIARFTEPDDEAVIAAAKTAGLHDAIVRLKNGYDTVLGPSGAGLSGGMRQRVALARAVYGNPRLVVLDEPNASLDSDGEAALNEAIAKLKRAQSTIVVVTHRPQLVTHADKVLILTNGELQAFGPRDLVLEKLRAVRSQPPKVHLATSQTAAQPAAQAAA